MVTSKESTKLVMQPGIPPAARKVRADLHFHGKTGEDLSDDLKPILEMGRKKLGAGGIVGLIDFENYGDHSRFTQLLRQAGNNVIDFGFAFYEPSSDILIVRGEEVPTRQGHLLVLGLDRDVHLTSHKDLGYSLDESEANDGINNPPHSFHFKGIGPALAKNFRFMPDCLDDKNFLGKIDAFSHDCSASLWIPFRASWHANEEALRTYSYFSGYYPHLGFIANSDGHSLSDLGRSYTTFQMPDYNKIGPWELREHLRKVIRGSKPENCVMRPGRLGALKHVFGLGAIIALRKVGVELK